MQAADLKRDMDVALERLVPMFKRLPENPDMALAAGRLLYAKGDPNLKPYATAVLALLELHRTEALGGRAHH